MPERSGYTSLEELREELRKDSPGVLNDRFEIYDVTQQRMDRIAARSFTVMVASIAANYLSENELADAITTGSSFVTMILGMTSKLGALRYDTLRSEVVSEFQRRGIQVSRRTRRPNRR